MQAPTGTIAPSEDVLTNEAHYSIDRSSEARLIIDVVSAPDQHLAVLYGKGGSGKTSLVREWVVPALSSGRQAYYGSCAPGIPERLVRGSEQSGLEEALSKGAIVFIDDFEQFLLLGDKHRIAEFGGILERLERKQLPGTLALVLRESNLSQLLAFRSAAPSLLEHTLEISAVSFSDGIQRISEARSSSGFTYDPKAIELLTEESEEYDWSGELHFIAAIDKGLRHSKGASSDRTISAEDYQAIGGLRGALLEYLREREDAAAQRFGPEAQAITEAVVEEIVEANNVYRAISFSGIPARLGVSKDLFQKVVGWLSNEGSLLKVLGTDRFDVIPPQLGRAITRQIEQKRKQTSAARRTLVEAVRTKRQFGVLLPQDRFGQVDEHRTQLSVSEEEAGLMVLSVLNYQDPERQGEYGATVQYWLCRIPSAEAKLSVLMEAVLNESPQVRTRAAALLSGFDHSDVRGMLHRAALEDPDAGVRKQAIDSLAGMQSEDLWPLVKREAQDAASPYREHAVAALRISSDPECVEILKAVVSDPKSAESLRNVAIQTLAAFKFPAAVEAITGIALKDEDVSDRLAAEAALSSIDDENLLATALASVRTNARNERRAHPLRPFAHLRSGSVASAVPLLLLIHGSAHALTGNWRRGVRLLVMELLAIACLVGGSYYFGKPEFGSLSEPLSQAFFLFYTLAGVGLLLTGFALDVVPVFRRRCLRDESQDRVLELLLAKREGTRRVLSLAISQDRPAARWAKRTIRRLADKLHAGEFADMLRRCGDQDLAPELARLMVLILKVHPTRSSVEAFREQWQRLDWRGRTRVKLAQCLHGLQQLPVAPVLMIALATPLAGYALFELHMSKRHPAVGQLRLLNALLKEGEKDKAIDTARSLARFHANESADDLIRIFATLKTKSSDDLNAELARSIGILACSSDATAQAKAARGLLRLLIGGRHDAKFAFNYIAGRGCKMPLPESAALTEEASKILTNGESELPEIDLALHTLRATADKEAFEALKEFAKIERQGSRVRWNKVDAARTEQWRRTEQHLFRLEAIAALIHIDSTRGLNLPESGGASQGRSNSFCALNEGQRTTRSVLDQDSIARLFRSLESSISRNDGVRREELEEEAIGYLKSATGIAGESVVHRALAEFRETRANRLLSEGQTEKALEEAMKALAEDHQFAPAHAVRGLILYQQARAKEDAPDRAKEEEAFTAFTVATKLNPEDVWSWCMQASIRLDRKQYAAAASLASRAIKARPEYSWSYTLLSESYKRQDKGLEAISLFEQLKKKHGDVYWPGRQLAALYQDYSPDPGPKAFAKVYALYEELDRHFVRALDGATLANHQANFLESRLTTGHYGDVYEAGNELQAELPPDDFPLRVPVSVILYANAILEDDLSAAAKELDELEATLKRVQEVEDVSWSYSGTLIYLKAQSIPAERLQALIRLVEAADRMGKGEMVPQDVIQLNRDMLRTSGPARASF